MENAFWDALQDICEFENVSCEEFVELARRKNPDSPIGSAVSVEVVAYIRARAGWLLTTQEAGVCGVHESLSIQPVWTQTVEADVAQQQFQDR